MTSNSKKRPYKKGHHTTQRGGEKNGEGSGATRNAAVVNPNHRSRLAVVTLSILCALSAVLFQKYGSLSSSSRTNKMEEGGKRSKSAQQNTTNKGHSKPRTTLSELFRVACVETQLVYCNDYLLELQNRTIYSRDALQEGLKLLEIPRGVHMTTLDALRDPFIQQELLFKNPRHLKTQQPLYPRAYLTAYLVFMSKARASQRRPKLPLERLQKAYLDYLPTIDEFASFHPLVHLDTLASGNSRSVQNYYHRHGAVTKYVVARNYEELISEFDAFCKVSPDIFAKTVTWQEYLTARLQIQSRSFQNQVALSQEEVSDQELQQYQPYLKVTSSSLRENALSSRLVPLLDAMNHHSAPNAGWKYVDDAGTGISGTATYYTGSFLVFSKQAVGPGIELTLTYGLTMPDSWLLAGYGFVTGDGSGRRAALLASFHEMYHPYFQSEADYSSDQEQQLKFYLSFDDGYEMCDGNNVTTPSEVQEFKRLKLAVLKKIANLQNSWVATVPPPPTDSLDEGIVEIISTCRLLALTHRDFAGHAAHMLQVLLDHFEASPDGPLPRMKRDNDALEYRAMHWLDRLAREGRKQMLIENLWSTASNSSVDDIEGELREYVNGLQRHSPEWAASYVRLGEVETLATLSRYAQEEKRKIAIDEAEGFIVRSQPCENKNWRT